MIEKNIELNICKRRESRNDAEMEREYFICADDERIIENKGADEKRINDYLDTFEDGYNQLDEIDGQLYEVMVMPFATIRRKAYLDKNDIMKGVSGLK